MTHLEKEAFRRAVHRKTREAWIKFCAEIEHIPDYARIHKILAKISRLLPSSLLKLDGSFTNSGEASVGGALS